MITTEMRMIYDTRVQGQKCGIHFEFDSGDNIEITTINGIKYYGFIDNIKTDSVTITTEDYELITIEFSDIADIWY
jgi:ribosome maturation factor RimP